MTDFGLKLKHGFYTGVKKGWKSFIWIMKIILPIAFLVTLLQWSGWLSWVDFWLKPLMGLTNLPAEAALPIIIGMLSTMYGAIAAIAVLPFTIEQITLIAIFTAIAHGLIMEGVIQGKSGISMVKITLIRITAATITVLIVSQFFDETAKSIVTTDLTVRAPIVEVLKVWAVDMLVLAAKIFIIITTIMIILESLAALGWTKYLLKPLQPFMKILGLSERVTMGWLVAVCSGLTFGAAVIIDEANKGVLSKEELEHLHISIGINHSIVEDPAIFMALGVNAFWLVVPRLVMAVITVWAFKTVKYLKKRISAV
ncbi:hypothetical protein ES703_88715 [subsurface metagenome]